MTDTPSAQVAPGFLAFVAFFLLAMALWFLMKNMNARMRRMSYRQQQAHRGRDEAQAGPGDVGDGPSEDGRSEDGRSEDNRRGEEPPGESSDGDGDRDADGGRD
ncbi:MAG TPA: hypothetical protein VLA55_10595 [Ornithinibacter sp.]|nr:hypothetical protein [Ornithinibacter sp.]